MSGELLDAIVVGGGPAGLSAALLLGRCRRNVLLFDEGRPRNAAAPALHGFLGHDGIPPLDLLARGRAELRAYRTIHLRAERLDALQRKPGSGLFHATSESGEVFVSRALLIATGLIDRLPELPGIEDYYGHSIHICPYCAAWENQDTPMAVLGAGDAAAELALELLLWSRDVALISSGGPPSHDLCVSLAARGIKVYYAEARYLHGAPPRLKALELSDGMRLPCSALFLVAAQVQHDDFLSELGCDLLPGSEADCDEEGRTPTPGLFAAGNATKGIQMAVVAAAEGLQAAAALNDWLLEKSG